MILGLLCLPMSHKKDASQALIFNELCTRNLYHPPPPPPRPRAGVSDVVLQLNYFSGPYLIYKCTCTFTCRNSSPASHILVSSEQLPAVVPYFCQPPRAGAFSGGFTTNLTPQCRALSWALKMKS